MTEEEEEEEEEEEGLVQVVGFAGSQTVTITKNVY